MTAYFLNNEVARGQTVQVPGDIQIFASREDVEQYFEPWYADETYLLLGSDGRRRLMVVQDGKIRLENANDETDFSPLLHQFLVHHLTGISHAVAARRKLTPEIAEIDWSDLAMESLFKIALLFK